MFPVPRVRRRRAGIALVIVLIALVLATILTVVFLARGGAERAAAGGYHAQATAGMLADRAVNLVQSQINEAISATGGSTGQVWCTQPGAVRIYDKTRSLRTIYRLYSAGKLTADTAKEIAENDLPTAAQWKSAPAVWTDLNEPVAALGLKDGSGNLLDMAAPGSRVYPILDARDPTPDPGDPQNARYLDTKTDEWGDNWGFSINGDPAANPVGATAASPCLPVRWIYVLQDGVMAAPASVGGGSTAVRIPGATAQNPVVGRIAFWTDDETCKVNINTAAGSRGLRPHLADGSERKLPLPAPWDSPRFKLFDERMLFSENQPVRGEYQRYPGHPATTDLFNIWNVLGMIGTGYPLAMTAYSDPVQPQPAPGSSPSAFYTRLPRYTDDYSSRGGVNNTTDGTMAGTLGNGIPKADRLFASLGEMLYDPVRNTSGVTRQQVESGKFFLTPNSRAPEQTLYGTPRVAMWPVNADTVKRTAYDQLLAFCATAGSGAKSAPYYFQRSNAVDPVSDWDNLPRNQQLYRYLQILTTADAPGFGGSLLGKYSAGRDQILTEMFDYIRSTNLTDHSGLDTPANRTKFAFTKTYPGQVTPLKIGLTRGLGRIPTLSEIGILIICTADGGSPLTYRTPVEVSGYEKRVSPVAGSANDPLYVSNLPETQFLRDTDNHIVGIDPGIPFPANRTLADDYKASDPGEGRQLAPGQKRLQAMLLLETACPMLGYDQMTGANNFQVAGSGLHGITVAGQHPFPDRNAPTPTTATGKLNGDGIVQGSASRVGSIQNYGGITGFRALLSAYATYGSSANPSQYNRVYSAWSGYNPAGLETLPYRFVSNPFTVTIPEGGRMTLSGGCTLKIQVPPPLASGTAVTSQTFDIDFPALSNLPMPDLPKTGICYQRTEGSTVTTVTTDAADWWGLDKRIAWTVYPNKAPATGDASFQPYLDGQKPSPYLGPGCVIRVDNPLSGKWTYHSTDTTRTYLPAPGAGEGRSDVVRTLVARDGDYRLTAALDTVDATGQTNSAFVKGPGYDDGGKLAHMFMDQGSSSGTAGVELGGKLVDRALYAPWFTPKVPAALGSDKQRSWDWDSGLPWEADGAYANKPDEGNTYVDPLVSNYRKGQGSPYYRRPKQTSQDLSSYFTANRIVPSPVMFGSLPTGVPAGNGPGVTWRTLLFRPQANRPAYADPPGPPDHLWLDLFTMPVVEPYAISEPFSTAGKINMNYQIQPFTFITRNTGVRAVLASELIAQVPLEAAGTGEDGTCAYKGSPTTATPPAAPHPRRLPLSLDETKGTLQQFEEHFRQGELFRSASEICDLYLVPRGYSLPAFKNAWYGDDFALVGDNVRERPYGDIYPRLTTRSNTFTVHYRVQVLRSPDAASKDPVKAGQWDERRGGITGEARGSATIERFLDPGRTDLPDYTNAAFERSLDRFHEWRVVATSQFPP